MLLSDASCIINDYYIYYVILLHFRNNFYFMRTKQKFIFKSRTFKTTIKSLYILKITQCIKDTNKNIVFKLYNKIRKSIF